MECQVDKHQHFRHLLLFAFNRGIRAADAAREIREMYGEDALSLKTAQNWFRRFKNGTDTSAECEKEEMSEVLMLIDLTFHTIHLKNKMGFWHDFISLPSARIEHILPILLIAVIFIILMSACLIQWWRERHAVDISIPPPMIPPPKITITDGKTGEERVLTQE